MKNYFKIYNQMWYRFITFTFNLIKNEINEKEFDFDLININI